MIGFSDYTSCTWQSRGLAKRLQFKIFMTNRQPNPYDHVFHVLTMLATRARQALKEAAKRGSTTMPSATYAASARTRRESSGKPGRSRTFQPRVRRKDVRERKRGRERRRERGGEREGGKKLKQCDTRGSYRSRPDTRPQSPLHPTVSLMRKNPQTPQETEEARGKRNLVPCNPLFLTSSIMAGTSTFAVH